MKVHSCDRTIVRYPTEFHHILDLTLGQPNETSFRSTWAPPISRGAEIAFISIAEELARLGEKVTLVGAGEGRISTPYRSCMQGALLARILSAFPQSLFAKREFIRRSDICTGLLLKYRPANTT